MLSLSFSAGSAPGLGRQVNEWKDDRAEVFARAFSLDTQHCVDWPGLGVFAFSSSSHQVRVWPYPNARHEDILNTFSRKLQPVILQALGWQALHAAAAAVPSGVLAFCGKAGSGKSTLGFAMNQAGYPHVADDALVLRLDRDHAKACPLPFAPRLRPASRVHFGYSSEQQPPVVEITCGELPLSAVFLLRQDHHVERPHLTRLPQAAAFSDLLAHAHCYDVQDAAQTQRLVDDYLTIVSHVPVYRLQYRPELQRIAELIDMVLEAAPSCDESRPLTPVA
jgi:hypothetical protein